MSSADKEGKQLFIFAELCGRQLVGYAKVDDLGPVEDGRGFVTVADPLELRTALVPTRDPVTEQERSFLVSELRPLSNLDWDATISIKVSSHRPALGGSKLEESYLREIRTFQQQWEASEAQRGDGASPIHRAQEVSPHDLAAHAAMQRLKVGPH